MAKIDNQNLWELDKLIERLKEFREYIGKHQGEEIRGSKIEDRFTQDL